jgi:hypothetical protein
MFILGIFLILGWLFGFFYYADLMPRYVSVGMVIAGLFSMGWGLLKGK